jgi:HAD superfamily hydrolase (TIGR01509 family)
MNRDASGHIRAIAFDVHYVLVAPHYSIIFKKIVGLLGKPLVLKEIINPYFWYNVYILFRQKPTFQDALNQLFDTFPQLRYLEPQIYDLANEQSIIPGMVPLIQELKTAGFKLYILSNSSPQLLKNLYEKYPAFFSLFDGELGVTDPPIQKPNLEFYGQFLSTFHLKPEELIFIDDHSNNVHAARKLGIYSIHFKNASLLRATLLCQLA